MAAQDYDPNSKSRFSHLTNNCVVKEYLKKEQVEYDEEENSGSDAEDDGQIDFDNIWSSDDFASFIQKRFQDQFPDQKDIFKEVIQKQIKD